MAVHTGNASRKRAAHFAKPSSMFAAKVGYSARMRSKSPAESEERSEKDAEQMVAVRFMRKSSEISPK